MAPDDPRHGTVAGYWAHRGRTTPCDPCRRAVARYQNERLLDQMAGRPRLVPSLGAARRLRALARIGWSAAALGERLGLSSRAVQSHMNPHLQITRTRHDQIAALYEALCMTTGPSSVAAARAENSGWAPPLAWDDDTIDNPQATPDGALGRIRVRPVGSLTPAQRKAAHAAYARGDRDPDVVAGEREYQRTVRRNLRNAG